MVLNLHVPLASDRDSVDGEPRGVGGCSLRHTECEDKKWQQGWWCMMGTWNAFLRYVSLVRLCQLQWQPAWLFRCDGVQQYEEPPSWALTSLNVEGWIFFDWRVIWQSIDLRRRASLTRDAKMLVLDDLAFLSVYYKRTFGFSHQGVATASHSHRLFGTVFTSEATQLFFFGPGNRSWQIFRIFN